MSGYLHENRVYFHPKQDGIQKGDHVILSDLNIPWEVTRVSSDGVNLHIRSLPGWGGRQTIVPTVRIRAGWRDPEQEPEIDWRQAYEEEL